MREKRKKLCIAGKNRIAVESLTSALDSRLFDVYACPTRSDIAVNTWQPSYRLHAAKLNVPILELEELYRESGLTFLSLEFDRIIDPTKFFDATLLNLHFSLLPAYKGCYTTIWPLYFREKFGGVTLHHIDHGIDTGPIIQQDRVILTEEMTSRSLYDLYQDVGHSLIKRCLIQIAENKLWPSTPQPYKNSSYYSRASLSKVSLELDLNATANQVSSQIRALFFPEYQTAHAFGSRIARCEVTTTRSTCRAGTLISETPEALAVATIDFDVVLHKWIT